MDPRNSSHYISLGKKLLVQHLIMEDLTYSVRVEPSKFSKMDKRGDVPCKGKMTQQKDWADGEDLIQRIQSFKKRRSKEHPKEKITELGSSPSLISYTAFLRKHFHLLHTSKYQLHSKSYWKRLTIDKIWKQRTAILYMQLCILSHVESCLNGYQSNCNGNVFITNG